MAISEVSVCNSALIKIGADRISSRTENVKSAICLNAIFDQIRDCELRDHPWNFAILRTTLAPTSTTPNSEYDYEYDLPSDCLRVLAVLLDVDDDGTEDYDYVIEAGKILIDESSIYVKYIKREDDPSEWDPSFAEALAWRLAREVAFNLTQSVSVVEMCEKGYRAAIAQARASDGMEGVLKSLVADDWTNERL